MELAYIYRPIAKELKKVEGVLESSLRKSKSQTILRINNFLLDSPGKRIRPALAILSAKATLTNSTRPSAIDHRLIKIAAAVELIHMASLVHDDVIDHSRLRHNKPTINSKWGQDVSIVLGDYLYSAAFDSISNCDNSDIIHCVSSATRTMCEGELLQVCERDNLDLLKGRYIVIVKKKTASLFAATCQAGSLVSNSKESLQNALRGYGLNFGIAFQMIDDYLDIVGEEQKLGKKPGQDIGAGEMTLPLLNLLDCVSEERREELKALLTFKKDKESFCRIKAMLFDSGAAIKTKETVSSFINSAKEKIDVLSHSPYKEGLLGLADFIMERGFNDKG